MNETQLAWIIGCVFLLGALLAYPALMTGFALMREQRILGKLYWHFITALDRRRRLVSEDSGHEGGDSDELNVRADSADTLAKSPRRRVTP